MSRELDCAIRTAAAAWKILSRFVKKNVKKLISISTVNVT